MRRRHPTPIFSVVIGLGFLGSLSWSDPASAQTFSSGSTGALGAFNPTTNTQVVLPPDGVLNYTTVTIPSGVTVTFKQNAANTPVTLLATGNITITGTVDVRGDAPGSDGQQHFSAPARSGPGGFQGGVCGATPVGGSGPGGGASGPTQADRNGTYGAPSAFVSLIPLFGGSGGAGCATSPGTFGGGGGGAGAIVMASSTKVTINSPGQILANGGSAGFISGNNAIIGGNGSGGAIRLVAPEVVGNGTLSAVGGQVTGTAQAGAGRIRIEAFTVGFTGIRNPVASVSTAPGPVTTASTPALTQAPTLTFTSVGGVAGPASSMGSYASADIALPQGSTNPLPVVLTSHHIPVGTVFTIKVIPQLSASSTVATSATTGSFESSTTTANVTLPTGEVSLLLAVGSFTLPQLAALMPEIDGEPVDHVFIATAYGGRSTLHLVSSSGKSVPVDDLPWTDQLMLAAVWESLATGHSE